jgi:aminopeptidase N
VVAGAARRGAHPWAWAALALALALCAALAAAPRATAQPSPGASGAGDPYFPGLGNSGYDVDHYAIDLRYSPPNRRLKATTTIFATATQDLSRFDLDLRGLTVTSVSVDGAEAAFGRDGAELVITPAAPLEAGSAFEVVVEYRGRPRPIKEPGGSIEGWIETRDGAFVVAEPRSARTWFPCNDHPSDKASYEFAVDVPRELTAVANGGPMGRTRAGGRTVFRWRAEEPMATYLATVAIGRFEVERDVANGIPSYVALDPKGAKRSRRALRRTPAILEFFADRFGAYPFAWAGAIVEDAGFLGYALETQTRPIFAVPPGEIILAHELAHQWYGDAVTPSTWKDIWLNEGFATWAEWLWGARRDKWSLRTRFRRFYRQPASSELWDRPPGDPGRRFLFDEAVYVRGAMTLEALRRELGAQAFVRILRAWYSEHIYGNVSTAEFIALAERESGRDLDRFFDVWLYRQGKPRNW